MQLEGIAAAMVACGIIVIEAAAFAALSIFWGCILSKRNDNDGRKKRKKQEKEKKHNDRTTTERL